jgi:hypothetical protein
MSLALVVAGYLVFWLCAWLWMFSHGRRLARERRAVGPDDFFGFFESDGVSREVTAAVQGYFQGFMRSFRIDAFPVLPADDVEEVYHLELDEVVSDLLEQCGREWPPQAEIQALGPMRTVADVVHLLARCPRAVEEGASNAGRVENRVIQDRF